MLRAGWARMRVREGKTLKTRAVSPAGKRRRDEGRGGKKKPPP